MPRHVQRNYCVYFLDAFDSYSISGKRDKTAKEFYGNLVKEARGNETFQKINSKSKPQMVEPGSAVSRITD